MTPGHIPPPFSMPSLTLHPSSGPDYAIRRAQLILLRPVQLAAPSGDRPLLVYLPGSDGTGASITPQLPGLHEAGFDVRRAAAANPAVVSGGPPFWLLQPLLGGESACRAVVKRLCCGNPASVGMESSCERLWAEMTAVCSEPVSAPCLGFTGCALPFGAGPDVPRRKNRNAAAVAAGRYSSRCRTGPAGTSSRRARCSCCASCWPSARRSASPWSASRCDPGPSPAPPVCSKPCQSRPVLAQRHAGRHDEMQLKALRWAMLTPARAFSVCACRYVICWFAKCRRLCLKATHGSKP